MTLLSSLPSSPVQVTMTDDDTWGRIGAQTRRFCYQFLQMETELDYPAAAELREEETQEFLYSHLFSDDARACGPPLRYRLRVLKELVHRIENSIDNWEEHGVLDNLMVCLVSLLAEPLPTEAAAAQQRCYVTYHLSALEALFPRPRITLLESRLLIAASGTTGFRTWEAAFHLGEYLCAHPSLVRGRRVLELGVGTGYISILCAKFLGAAHCLASDGSDDVINNLPDNLFLNGLQGLGSVTPLDLKWGSALIGTEEARWNGGREVDVVLGADIAYDRAAIPPLVATLDEIASLYPRASILISAIERDKDTFEVFRQSSARARFAVEMVDFEVPKRSLQRGPFHSDEVPIHICRLYRRN